MTLANAVFGAIAARFDSRSDDIALIAETQYSFEEWCNWEAFIACKKEGWRVTPRPQYKKLGLPGVEDFGDLLIGDDYLKSEVLVEVGVVHSGTGDKWISKLNNDTAKVMRALRDGVIPLQLILAVSIRNKIEVCRVWQDWLSRIDCWCLPTSLQQVTPLPPQGQMVLRGWVYERRVPASPSAVLETNID